MASAIDNWNNKNSHVESTINNGSSFTNAAHTVIYARLAMAGADQFYAIGVIQGWSFTEQRQVEEIFELGSDIRYIIPGRTTGQIAITRLLINGADLVNTLYGTLETNSALVAGTFKSLKDINKPLDLMFVAYNNEAGSDGKIAPAVIRYFDNCWIVARQESITANQVVIAENCTLVFEKVDTAVTTPGNAATQA